MKTIIERAEANIRQGLEDYGRHTTAQTVLRSVTDKFIRRLACDSSNAKQELRELFSKSPAWNEELDAIVINGTRTHDPDYEFIQRTVKEILKPAFLANRITWIEVIILAKFFGAPNDADREANEEAIDLINRIAHRAYSPTRKLTRVFRAICNALGVVDDTSGSEYSKLSTRLADEMASKKIDFKLFVSINPAHFLTMSNPKEDERGKLLTSCHSFNSTEHDWNNGCSGYARDKYSFIVFTVKDPDDAETLNNRKTTRQIFAYKPGNGFLFQSRIYNSNGGASGITAETKLYRDLVQREISDLEGAVNKWSTQRLIGSKYEDAIQKGEGFGGYCDWRYADFCANISIRKDHQNDFQPLTIGCPGLCVVCGEEISNGLYCEDCFEEREGHRCEWCGEYTHDDIFTVRDRYGNRINACWDCIQAYFIQCEDCDEYWPSECVTIIDGRAVCDTCLQENYERCVDCGRYVYRSDAAYDEEDDSVLCDECYRRREEAQQDAADAYEDEECSADYACEIGA